MSPKTGHLRRTGRRPRQHEVLQHLRFDLRFVQPQTRAGGSSGGSASGVVEVNRDGEMEEASCRSNWLLPHHIGGRALVGTPKWTFFMLTFIAILAVAAVIYAVYSNAVTSSKNSQAISEASGKPLTTYREKMDFIHSITGKFAKPEAILLSMDKSFGILAEYPNDEAINRAFLNYAQRTFSLPAGLRYREKLYRGALSTLARSKVDLQSTSRMFVLDLARWHYSSMREDKRLTSYDEQAIQNDISALFSK